MRARVFSTDIPLPPGQGPDLARLIPLIAATLDQAFTYAARLLRAGSVVWRIEESSQVFDGPGRIVAECQARGLLPYTWRG